MIRPLFLIVMLILMPAVVGAQHEEHASAAEHDAHHHLTLVEALSQRELQGAIVNFIVLMVALSYFGGKKIRASLEERKAQVEKELEEAKRLKAAAEAKHAEYQRRLEKLDQDLEEIRDEMIKAGEAERDRLISEAEKKAAAMRRESGFLVEQRIKQLREDVMRETIHVAIATAEKILREQATPEDQQRLSKSYVNRLSDATKAGSL